MKKFILLTSLIIFALCIQSQAQSNDESIEATTKTGKAVILKADGTWNYKAENDSKAVINELADKFATVYFFRVKEIGKFAHQARGINVNDRELFKIPQTYFIGVKLKAGDYKLKMQQNQTELHIQFEEGKTYYIRVSETSNGNGYQQSLNETPEKQAAFQISLLSALTESNIKSKDFTFITVKPEYK